MAEPDPAAESGEILWEISVDRTEILKRGFMFTRTHGTQDVFCLPLSAQTERRKTRATGSKTKKNETKPF